MRILRRRFPSHDDEWTNGQKESTENCHFGIRILTVSLCETNIGGTVTAIAIYKASSEESFLSRSFAQEKLRIPSSAMTVEDFMISLEWTCPAIGSSRYANTFKITTMLASDIDILFGADAAMQQNSNQCIFDAIYKGRNRRPLFWKDFWTKFRNVVTRKWQPCSMQPSTKKQFASISDAEKAHTHRSNTEPQWQTLPLTQSTELQGSVFITPHSASVGIDDTSRTEPVGGDLLVNENLNIHRNGADDTQRNAASVEPNYPSLSKQTSTQHSFRTWSATSTNPSSVSSDIYLLGSSHHTQFPDLPALPGAIQLTSICDPSRFTHEPDSLSGDLQELPKPADRSPNRRNSQVSGDSGISGISEGRWTSTVSVRAAASCTTQPPATLPRNATISSLPMGSLKAVPENEIPSPTDEEAIRRANARFPNQFWKHDAEADRWYHDHTNGEREYFTPFD